MSGNQNNIIVIDKPTKDLEDKMQAHLGSIDEDIYGTLDTDQDRNFEESDLSSDDEADEKSESAKDNDIIDEEELMETERNLTDDEIEKRRKESIDLKRNGNAEYKEGKYLESIETYTKALKICPTKYKIERSILYGNRAASKINVGKKKSAIEDCTKSLELNERYVRAYLRRAKLFEEEDKLDECLEDYKKVLEIEPNCIEALAASQRLPPMISEKNEKLKEEMLGKLKDLGNLVLKPFGLSTDNFKLEQNPETGGYSINFNQNKQGKTY